MSLYDENGLDTYTADDEHLAPPAADPNGLGSLADELAGAFDDEGSEEEEGDDDGEGAADEGEGGEGNGERGGASANGSDGSGATKATTGGAKRTLPPASASDYDGSDYGDPEDLVETGISFGLEDKLAQIERLALTSRGMVKGDVDGAGLADADGEAGAVPRLMEGLQKLLPQSALETGSTRLITAHSALSSHMLHQTRTLRDLSFALSTSSLPPPETSELLLSLIDVIPRPTLQPLAELSALHGLTLQLISQLSFLSDSLHMARQSSIAANRKLRVAKEACADWKNELEAVEKARRWIEDGDWDARCKRREAADVCREVLGGFGDVCEGFEEKLRAQSVVA